MPAITMSWIEDISDAEKVTSDKENCSAAKLKARSFADIAEQVTFIQAGSDPFYNSVDYTKNGKLYFEDACEMPEGYSDTPEERRKREEDNPIDDSAMLGPIGEDIDDYLEASHCLVHQISAPMTNCRRLGSRASYLRPELDEKDYDDDGCASSDSLIPNNKSTYSDFNRGVMFDRRVEQAMIHRDEWGGKNV